MRLIDLDKLKQNLCGECTMNFPKECRQIGCAKVDKQDILDALRIPIIDAVTVADIIEVEKERNYWHDLADSYERTILKLTKALEEANRGRREHETD